LIGYSKEKEIEMYYVDVSEVKEKDKILKYIRKYVKKNYKKGPTKSYLLQCADWRPSECNKMRWIAYSPVSYGRDYGYWPLYNIRLEYSDKECIIEFHSWKGDYEPKSYHLPHGNLPKKPKTLRNFKGTIWTRGE
jgi:hypothetical protein